MFALPPGIPTRAGGAARASGAGNSCRRLLFSTSHAVRSGGGPLFNLGGLGASREAQYLSREHGIPRAEYSANIHLIRSSEVDPFAPAPGSTRAAAARAAARARAEPHPHPRLASTAAPGVMAAPHLPAADGSLAAQLQEVRRELAETRRALRGMQAGGGENPGASMTSHLLSTAVILAAILYVGRDVIERITGWSPPAGGLAQAQALADDVDGEAAAQRRRDAPVEERALAESGLTSFEDGPANLGTYPRGSVLSGLFWART